MDKNYHFIMVKVSLLIIEGYNYINIFIQLYLNINDYKRWPLVRNNVFVIVLIWDANHKVSAQDDASFSNFYLILQASFLNILF